MFNARFLWDNQIYQVLATHRDEVCGVTSFLIWRRGEWFWSPACNFVPPNVEVKK